MTNTRITKRELGGIRYIEVRLPDRPSITVGRDDEHLADTELIARATAYWQAWDRKEATANTLRNKYNKQVFIGNLPANDIDTELNGYYAYVLKDRRRHNKYQILEAIPLGQNNESQV